MAIFNPPESAIRPQDARQSCIGFAKIVGQFTYIAILFFPNKKPHPKCGFLIEAQSLTTNIQPRINPAKPRQQSANTKRRLRMQNDVSW